MTTRRVGQSSLNNRGRYGSVITWADPMDKPARKRSKGRRKGRKNGPGLFGLLAFFISGRK